MATVSGCILAKNEEDLIKGCIDSLKPFVNEIIVVDNGSADRTAEIAKREGCIVIPSPDSEVDKGRNKYIESASMDWLLILDADERLDVDRKTNFFSALDHAGEDVMQFRLPWFNYTGNGKFVETSTAARMIRRDPRIRYNDFTIHASTTDSVKAIGGKCKNLYFPIHHYDILFPKRTKNKRALYRVKLEEKIQKHQAGEALSPLENIYVQYLFLGVEYSAIGDFQTAIHFYDYVIHSKDGTADMAALFKAYSLLCMKEWTEAYELSGLLTKGGAFVERAYGIQAEISIQLHKREEAIQACLDALHYNERSTNTLINLGVLYEKEDPAIAMDYFKRGIGVNPRILDKFLYKEPCVPNVYSFQETVVTPYRGIFSHMQYCCEAMGKSEELQLWWESDSMGDDLI